MSNEKQVVGASSLEEGLARVRARKPSPSEGIACPNLIILGGFAEDAPVRTVYAAPAHALLPSLLAYDLAMADLEARAGQPLAADSRDPRPSPHTATEPSVTEYFDRFDAATKGHPRGYEF